MKYVKIAYFDMMFNMSVWTCIQTGQDMNFTVEQNDACIRFVAPQVVLFYAAPGARTPARTCMHDLDKRRNLT